MIKYFKKKSIKKKIDENYAEIKHYEDWHYTTYGHNNYNKFFKQRLDYYKRDIDLLKIQLEAMR